ncbi:MAG: hypothetical protein KME03_14290 [Aphanocapsa lilacina HA4352-LM1]|jgi:hypothetical protein|nr:hypothetical protein [Aphanocapsa lilacina HA4352-LM1]
MNGLDKFTKKYRLVCTLTFGDIYGQVVVWLIGIFVILALSLSLMGSSPVLALGAIGLIIVVSLPFLLFAFVTTLFSHIEVYQTNYFDDSALKTKAYSRSDSN